MCVADIFSFKLEFVRWLGFFFSSRRRHTRLTCDWSSDVCSSDFAACVAQIATRHPGDPRREVDASIARLFSYAAWADKIGRASCRERELVQGSALSSKKKNNKIVAL